MKKGIVLLATTVALLSLFSGAHTTVWYVHPDSALSSIQAGLDSCSTDDTVLVAAGTYYENLTWPSTQGIDLVSEFGADTTVIDGSGATYVIGIGTGVHSTTTVSGFTIMNGYGYEAGGIHCLSSSPTITGNTVTMNTADYGGAIECDMGSSPIITGNTITGNTGYSGGIECWRNSSPTITGNAITGNVAYLAGGIACYDTSSPTIAGNTINGNTAEWGGGIACYTGCSPEIRGNDISGNTADSSGGGIDLYANSSPTIVGNMITANTAALGAGIACQNDCSPIIDSCTVSGNTAMVGGGISCHDNSNPSIDSCTISGNSGDGVTCGNASSPEIHWCEIVDNTGYGVQNVDSSVTVDAESNWWGCELGPSGVGPGTGDEVSEWVDYDPWLTGFGVTETVSPTSPTQFILFQNYPNPFACMTNIHWSLPTSCHTILRIYNVSGQLVRTLVDEYQRSGNYTACWDGKDNSAQRGVQGVYFYRLESGNFTSIKKMILLQ